MCGLERIWTWAKRCAAAGVLAAVAGLAVNGWVYLRGEALVVSAADAKPSQTAMVLGALVYADGRPSPMLQDRLDTALALYRAEKVSKILVTGDHGRGDYDEVNAMRRYLEERGVPTADVFMDHAGFDTYNSMYRARDVFEVQDVTIVTQRFHLIRALYIARSLGLTAQGVEADLRPYPGQSYYDTRELAARLKAFGEVALGQQPTFLGPVIPITGDGRATHDQPADS